MSFLTGLILSAIIGFAAYYKKSLSLGGFITAIITGALVYMFGGIYFYVLLMGFFISSSLLTKLNESKKKDIEKLHTKSGSRDASQVLTNILPAVIYGAIYYFTGNEIFLVAYASFFAASNADTWASEIGVLSGKLPVSIITLKELPRGISGGVSRLGIIASLLGAVFLSIFFFAGYVLTFGYSLLAIIYTAIIIVTGFAGSIIDSLLGATLQAKYKTRNEQLTEKRYHVDGENRLVKGVHFVTNNTVNILSTLSASFLAIGGSLLLNY